MPVTRASDGTWITGLDPAKVPAYAKPNGNTIYVNRPRPSIPVNKNLASVKGRTFGRDPSTGAIIGPFPAPLANLYRRGGLLYNPDTADNRYAP